MKICTSMMAIVMAVCCIIVRDVFGDGGEEVFKDILEESKFFKVTVNGGNEDESLNRYYGLANWSGSPHAQVRISVTTSPDFGVQICTYEPRQSLHGSECLPGGHFEKDMSLRPRIMVVGVLVTPRTEAGRTQLAQGLYPKVTVHISFILSRAGPERKRFETSNGVPRS